MKKKDKNKCHAASKKQLKVIIRGYIKNDRPRMQDQLKWFRQQRTLRQAVENAALAVDNNDKRYSHQWRLKKKTLAQARKVLLANLGAIAKSKSFDDLFTRLEAMLKPISGIGELYVYDTSLRIGAKLDLLPTKVYLHAGTRIGARNLGLDPKAKALKISDFPSEFQQLEPYEIEDLLCIYRDDLKK